MAPMLRKRLTCHYCGHQLNAIRMSNSKINCKNCLADNHFDAQNNFTDVPASEAARSRAGASQPVEVESASDVFCKTCIKNQSFYRHALADYLPDEDDPRYEELEDALPEFQRDLELRYPQCCAQCAPKVQARIHTANYAAKADHLRRTVRRRHGRHDTLASRSRSLLISLAGLGSLAGLTLQLAWHAFASQIPHAKDVLSGTTVVKCLRTWPIPQGCANIAASAVPVSLVIGLLCIWWNPEWQRRLSGQEGRLRGLRSYYLVQVSILALRFAVWLALQELSAIKPYSHIVHAMTLVLLVIACMYAHFGIIYLDTTPLVNWNIVNKPLVDPKQFQPPVQRPVPAINTPPSSQFSINSLAGAPQSAYEQWQPPTPPGDDSMDWAPTSHVFNPRPKPLKPRLDQPSPFYGTLPAAPVRGSLDPRKPEQQSQQKAIGVPPGFFGLSKSRDQTSSALPNDKSEFSLAPARFFAHEREADTGLENIFDKMFSVRDPLDPMPAKMARTPTQAKSRTSFDSSTRAPRTSHGRITVFRMVLCCSTIVALVVVTTSNCIVDYVLPEAQQSASNLMLYATLVPLLHLIDQSVLRGQIHNGQLAIPVLQGFVLAIARVLKPNDGSAYVTFWNKVVVAVMCLLLLQEIHRFCQLQSPTVSPMATAQMVQSMQKAEKDAPAAESESNAPSPLEQNTQTQSITSLTRDPLRYASPQPVQRNPFKSFAANTSPIRKQASNESISSVSSTQTTSTASGWKTPHNENRTYDWREHEKSHRRPSNTIARGLGGLSLDNDFGFGSGTGIAGPRTRSKAQGGRNVFGR